jgi:hypothetical protein
VALDFAFFHAVIISCEKVVDKQIVVGQSGDSNHFTTRESKVKIILERDEIKNILITYLESLLPNTKFNKCDFDCSGYSTLYKVTISHEQDDAE